MFVSQLFKIFFIAVLLYMMFNVLMFFLRLGRQVRGNGQGREKVGRQPGPGGSFRAEGQAFSSPRSPGGRRDIELDKDQYKVE